MRLRTYYRAQTKEENQAFSVKISISNPELILILLHLGKDHPIPSRRQDWYELIGYILEENDLQASSNGIWTVLYPYQ